MHSCPCCGFTTLPQRASYDLCPVCSWEDDGGEPWTYSGPNGETLVEAQQRYLAQRLPHRLRPGKVRAPRRGEARPPGWRPVEVTDDLLARMEQEKDDGDRSLSLDAAPQVIDDHVDENLRAYNEANARLRVEAASLPHAEVRSRLRALSHAHGIGFSDAHVELFARLMKDETYYRGHPLRTAWWLVRHHGPMTWRQRRHEARTGRVFFVG